MTQPNEVVLGDGFSQIDLIGSNFMQSDLIAGCNGRRFADVFGENVKLRLAMSDRHPATNNTRAITLNSWSRV